MNRIAWHIPLGIIASLVAHFGILSLLLGGFHALSTSPSASQKFERPLQIEAIPKTSEPAGKPEPKIINEETTIQFR